MHNVLHIPLTDVLSQYKGYSSGDFAEANNSRTMTICPFHGDTNPSMALYDNGPKGQYYKCFVCGAHGNAITMVTQLGVAENSGRAEEVLRKDFGMEFPMEVTLEFFCDWKGISLDSATAMGWENNRVGFVIPYYDTEDRIIGKKVRCKYNGKDKYFWDNSFSEVNDFHYGWQLLAEYDDSYVVFVEGETDFMTLREAGMQVIGINGNLGFLGHKYGHLYDRFAKKLVLRDNDKAGKALLDMISSHFQDSTYELVIENSHKDVNDLYNFSLGRDATELRAIIDRGVKYPASVDTVANWLRTQTPALLRNEKVLARLMRIVKTPFETTLVIEMFAERFEKSKTTIKELLTAVKGSSKMDGSITEGLQNYDGCYWKTKTVKGVSYDVAISNFTIKPQHVVDVEGVSNRVLTLVNTDGVTARDVVFTPDDFANTQKFNVRCMSAGPYHFTGDAEDLHDLTTYLINSKVPTVYSIGKSGRITPSHWLFRNFGINQAGEIIPVESGRVTLDGKTYIPATPGDTSGAVTTKLALRPDFSHDPAAWEAMPDALLTSYGTPDVLLALGTILASAASDAIFKQAGSFPLIFIAGKRASGKTTLAEMLYSLFGGEGAHSYHSTTPAAISRIMGQYHSLPILLDDFRANQANASKNDTMLNVYNRQGKLRADSNFGSGVKADPIACTMMLSGEDLPTDNALTTRCINVSVTAHKGTRTPETLAHLFYIFQEAAHGIPSHIARLHADPEPLLQEIARWRDGLITACPEPRQRQNLSVALGGLSYSFSLTEEMRAILLAHVGGKSSSDRADIDSDHTLAQFMNTIGDMITTRDLTEGHHWARGDAGKLLIRLTPIIQTMEVKNRRVYLEATIRLYLKEEPFYVGTSQEYGFDGKRMRCIVLDPAKMDSTYNDLKESMKSKESEY